MEIEEFRKELIEDVKVAAQEAHDFEASAFVEVAAKLLSDAGELADFETCHYRGTGTRQRSLAIDGYAFDEADESVRVLVADWDGGSAPKTLTQTEARTLLGRSRGFLEEALTTRFFENLENSTEVYALAKELYLKKGSISRFRAYLITDRILSGRAKDFPEGRVGGVPVEFHIWDSTRFHRLAESKSGRDDLEISFQSRADQGIPCISASVEAGDYKAYLCIIRGDVLAGIYDEFGSRLLEGNVRSFLTAKGKINKGIRDTIRAEPQMFFAYNNGIAATATEAQVELTRHGLRLLTAKDFQIVNGGQTTASLAMAMREGGAALDSIFVQMKLSVIPAERSGQVIPLISRYANSQNKVSDADFFSNHDYHRRLEMLSRQIWAPAVGGAQYETHWFYERARGQYANEQARLSKSERKRFLLQNPKKQVMIKTDVAKVESAWRRKPHVVCLGAQKNFTHFAEAIQQEWEKGDAKFNREYFTGLVGKTIIFNETERIVVAQPWYQGGYRRQIVAHSVAKLVDMVTSQYPDKEIDLARVWATQSVSEGLQGALRKIATAVHEVIINPIAGYANITEWCKREQCWNRVVALRLELEPSLIAELCDRESGIATRREAKKAQEEEAKITVVMHVVHLGPLFWSSLRQWGDARRLWTDDENRLLALASRKNFVPLDRQAVRLMALRERASDEGFVKTA